jgi:hypothetical protein
MKSPLQQLADEVRHLTAKIPRQRTLTPLEVREIQKVKDSQMRPADGSRPDMKARWADPVWRKKQKQRMRDAQQRRLHSTPISA